MTRKRIFVLFAVVLMMAICACSLVACKTPANNIDNTQTQKPTPPTSGSIIADEDPEPSEKLDYELTADEKAYVFAGLGKCNDNEVVIADVYNELPVIGIKENALPNSDPNLRGSVAKIKVLGNELQYVEAGAFRGCSTITEIDLPDSVKSIGNAAFKWCSSLASFTLPSSITSVGDGAFYGCSKLATITIPEAITKISPQLFYDCSGLEQVTISEKTTSIGYDAFRSCSKLTAIYTPSQKDAITEEDKNPANILPSTIANIGERAFMECIRLEKIVLPDAVKTISEQLFYGCTKLKSVTLGKAVTLIDNAAFHSCRVLESINIPNSLTQINSYAFAVTPKLETVVFNEGLVSIGDYAFHSSGLKVIDLKDTVTYIGLFAFEKCNKLEEVKMSVSEKLVINMGAFFLSGVLPEVEEDADPITSGRNFVFTFNGTEADWNNKVLKFGPIIWGDADSKIEIKCSDKTVELKFDSEVQTKK